MTSRVFIAAACMTVLIHAPAAAQDAQTKRAIGKLLESYATVNGGWVLNQRCQTLDREGRREMEWHLARVNVVMARQFGDKTLAPMRMAASEVADDPKYADCGPKVAGIIDATAQVVRNMDKALTQGVYDPASSYRDYVAGRYAAIEGARRLDQRCAHVPEDARDNFAAAHKWVATRIAVLWGDGLVQDMDRKAGTIAAEDRFRDCGTLTTKAVRAGAQELWLLHHSLKADEALAD